MGNLLPETDDRDAQACLFKTLPDNARFKRLALQTLSARELGVSFKSLARRAGPDQKRVSLPDERDGHTHFLTIIRMRLIHLAALFPIC
jgi:hypothetical protein